MADQSVHYYFTSSLVAQTYLRSFSLLKCFKWLKADAQCELKEKPWLTDTPMPLLFILYAAQPTYSDELHTVGGTVVYFEKKVFAILGQLSVHNLHFDIRHFFFLIFNIQPGMMWKCVNMCNVVHTLTFHSYCVCACRHLAVQCRWTVSHVAAVFQDVAKYCCLSVVFRDPF